MAWSPDLTFIFQDVGQNESSRRAQKSVINRHVSRTSHQKRRHQRVASHELGTQMVHGTSDRSEDTQESTDSQLYNPTTKHAGRFNNMSQSLPVARPSGGRAGLSTSLVQERNSSTFSPTDTGDQKTSPHFELSLTQRDRDGQINTWFPLQTGYGGLRSDPFRTIPGVVADHQSPAVDYALDYYVQVMAPAYEPVLLALSLSNPMMSWLFPLMLHNSDVFHSALAVTLTHLHKRRNPDATSPSKEVTFHRRKAMQSLRDRLMRLGGVPDDAAIATVMDLACLEMLYKERTTESRRALGMMVALRGGLDKLGSGGRVKGLLVQLDYFWVLEGASTVFPLTKRRQPRKYPAHPFPPNVCELISFLPPGFEGIAMKGRLGEDVLQILRRVALSVFPSSASTLKAESEHLVTDCPDIFDVCSCLQPATLLESSLEQCLCLTVVLFAFNLHWLSERVPTYTQYRASRSQLTRCLPHVEPSSPEERECLIWMWVVVLDSWRIKDELAKEGVDLSIRMLEKLQIQQQALSWTWLQTLLRRFLWHGGLSTEWKKSWEMLCANFRLSLSQSEAVQLGSGQPTHMQTAEYATQIGSGTSPGRTYHASSSSKVFRPESASTVSRDIKFPDRSVVGDTAIATMGTYLPSMLTLDIYLDELDKESIVEH